MKIYLQKEICIYLEINDIVCICACIFLRSIKKIPAEGIMYMLYRNSICFCNIQNHCTL